MRGILKVFAEYKEVLAATSEIAGSKMRHDRSGSTPYANKRNRKRKNKPKRK